MEPLSLGAVGGFTPDQLLPSAEESVHELGMGFGDRHLDRIPHAGSSLAAGKGEMCGNEMEQTCNLLISCQPNRLSRRSLRKLLTESNLSPIASHCTIPVLKRLGGFLCFARRVGSLCLDDRMIRMTREFR